MTPLQIYLQYNKLDYEAWSTMDHPNRIEYNIAGKHATIATDKEGTLLRVNTGRHYQIIDLQHPNSTQQLDKILNIKETE